MGKWKYRKLGPTHIREMCVACGKNKQRRSTATTYAPICSTCDRRRYETAAQRKNRLKDIRKYPRKPYTKHKGPTCEACRFIPQHSCQLDVHHIDGDHENNEPTNLKTLCSNCHRLVTHCGKL